MAAITLTGLTIGFGDNTVIDGLDLAVEQGRFFTLLAPSGCGKKWEDLFDPRYKEKKPGPERSGPGQPTRDPGEIGERQEERRLRRPP